MGALEAKAALLNAIMKAAKIASDAGLSDEAIAAVLEMAKDTMESGE